MWLSVPPPFLSVTPFPSALASVALLLLSPHPLGPPQLNSVHPPRSAFVLSSSSFHSWASVPHLSSVESSSDSHPSPCPSPHPAPHQSVPTVPSCCPSGLPQRQLHLLGGMPLVCGTHLLRPPLTGPAGLPCSGWVVGSPSYSFLRASPHVFSAVSLLSFLGIRRPLARRGGKPWMGGHRWGRDRGSPGGSGQGDIWSWE